MYNDDNKAKKLVISVLVALVGAVLLGVVITVAVRANYEYDNQVLAEWTLADRSSTIPSKAAHIDKFVATLGVQNLRGKYDALFMPTPSNGFDQNFEALKTLQSRLHEIEGMDPTSFQYQAAIQQITAQEQGEAQEMLSVFQGVWTKEHHIMAWGWILGLEAILSIALIVVGVANALRLWIDM